MGKADKVAQIQEQWPARFVMVVEAVAWATVFSVLVTLFWPPPPSPGLISLFAVAGLLLHYARKAIVARWKNGAARRQIQSELSQKANLKRKPSR